MVRLDCLVRRFQDPLVALICGGASDSSPRARPVSVHDRATDHSLHPAVFPGWRDDLERRYLEIFDLPPNRKISALSKGMRTGLMLLLAISHLAELLILDEPTEGLDPPVTEILLRELVALPASEGTTIFFVRTS